MQKVKNLAHMGYIVKDLERSLQFYRDALGLEHFFDLKDDDGQILLSYLRVTDSEFIELLPRSDAGRQSPATGALNHLCFEVGDIAGVVEVLAAQGIDICQWQVIEGVLQLIPVQPPAKAIGDGIDGNRQAWLRDPDGNAIELMQMLPGNRVHDALTRKAR